MRRSGASIFIYLIFGLLVAIFVININPGKSGQGGGCGCSRSNLVVDVGGARANETGYKIYYSAPDALQVSVGQSKHKEQLAVEGLIRREILASAAADLGLRVTPEMVQEEIKKGLYFTHLPPIDPQRWRVDPTGRFDMGENIFTRHVKDSTGQPCPATTEIEQATIPELMGKNCIWWDQRKFANWVGIHNVSKQSYLEEQARSLQATLMADLLASTVRVSRDEAKAAWLFDKNTVTYDVVAFSPVVYKGVMLLSEADVERYADIHKDAVEKKFKEEENTYKDTKPAIRVRQLYVSVPPDPVEEPKKEEPKKDEPKKDEPKPAGTGSAATGSGSAAPAAAGSAAAGSAAPAPAAGSAAPAAGSATPPAPAAGSGSGSATPPPPPAPEPKKWVKGEEMKAKVAAQKALIDSGKKKWAEVVAELSTDQQPKHNGGDQGWMSKATPTLTNAELNKVVKELKVGQISEPILIEQKGVYLLFVEAERSGTLELKQVRYEIAEKLAKENWGKEQAKREALKAVKGAEEGKSLEAMFGLEPKRPGGLDMEYLQDPTVPNEEKERYLRQMQRQGAIRQPIEIEGQDVPASSKAQAGGSSGSATSAGSATGAGSAGSGSATAQVTPGAAPKAPEPPAIEPTTDKLPEFETYAPKATRHENQTKRSSMPGIGKLANVLFEELREGQVVKRVYEHNNQYIVFQLIKKAQPEDAKFAEDADTYIEELRAGRARRVIEDFVRKRCEALRKENKITAYRGHEYDDNQNIKSKFEPCFSFQPPGSRAVPAPAPQ